MQTTFRFASLIWVFLQRCISRCKIPPPRYKLMFTGISHSVVKPEFFILLASLKHVPPSVFPISVNVTIIYQLFKLKPWESSLTPPLHPPACHNPIPATIISLLDTHITLSVSSFLPLVPPNQSPCSIPDDANVHIQIMPST